MLKSSQRKVNKNCSEIIFYIIYLPPIDVLLLEGFPVKLGPGTQVIEPGHHFLRRPARHRFTDQRVMLVDHTTAPVIHQHHHLETHTVIKTQYSDHLFTLLAPGCVCYLDARTSFTGLHGGMNPSKASLALTWCVSTRFSYCVLHESTTASRGRCMCLN